MRRVRILTLVGVGFVWAVGTALGAHDMTPGLRRAGFHTAIVVDYRNPVPPEWLGKAGIDVVYICPGIPIQWDAKTRRARLRPKVEAGLTACFRRYEASGIKVLVLSNFHRHAPKGALAVDASKRPLRMPCVRAPAYLTWLRKTVKGLAEALAQYKAFGGFCFDDGAGTRVDCCYCPVCVEAFGKETGTAPPPFTPVAGTGRIAPDDARLLWDQFNRRSFAGYLRAQSEAVRSVSRDYLMVTIPADCCFYGRNLNAQVKPSETPNHVGARLQRMTRCRLKPWHLFQGFPFPRLPEAGEEGFQPWAVGCHFGQPTTCMVQTSEGPTRFVGNRRVTAAGPMEIARMARFTVAEGAPGVAYWASPGALPAYPEAFDAIGSVHRDVARLGSLLATRRPAPAQVGVLYSTTTEVLEQPWRVNTLERWRHLHAWEAVAYTLRRANVPFRVVLESELDGAGLDGLKVLVLPGVRFLCAPRAAQLEAWIRRTQRLVLADPGALPIQGATVVDFEPYDWYEKQRLGYRQPRHLEAQRHKIAAKLMPLITPHLSDPGRVESDALVSFRYVDRAGRPVLFLVNWDLYEPQTARLLGPWVRGLADLVPSSLPVQAIPGGVRVAVPPAGWRVLGVRSAPVPR